MSNSWYDYDEFIKPAHLNGSGATLKIVGIGEIDSAMRAGEKQPALSFAPNAAYPILDKKRLTVNATNRKLLAETFGHETRSCIGKWVHLRAGKAQNGKDTVILSIASEPTPTAKSTPVVKLDPARVQHLGQLRKDLESTGGTPRSLTGIKFTPESLEQEIADTATALARGNDIAATADDLRAWAIANHVNDESIADALEQAGGLVYEAHAILEKAMVTK